MNRVVTVRGRLRGQQIELETPIDQPEGEVEVVVRSIVRSQGAVVNETIFDFVRKLPPGSRTKDDIDRQMLDERDAWNGR